MVVSSGFWSLEEVVLMLIMVYIDTFSLQEVGLWDQLY